MPGNPVAEEAVRNVLLGVMDPELGDNIVDLGMVQRIEIDPRVGDVGVTIALTTAGCPLRAQIMKDIKLRVASLPGVAEVGVHFGEMTTEQKKNVMAPPRFKARQRARHRHPGHHPHRCHRLGQGRSGQVVGHRQPGRAAGPAGADGRCARRRHRRFSIPRMLGVEGPVQGKEDETGRARFAPLEKPTGPGLLKVRSMGSIEGTGEDQAIMWRGFMLNRAVQHFLEDVAWGDMHYVLIDMPPGTADIQMGLARMMPRTGVVIVTTPALAAQQVAARAADMARKGYLRVAGVVENMSASVAPDDTRYAVFDSGGGERLAEQLGVPCSDRSPLTRPWPPGATPVSRPRSPRRTHRQPKPSPPWPSASSPKPSRSSRWPPAPPDSSSKPPVSSTPCRSHSPMATT